MGTARTRTFASVALVALLAVSAVACSSDKSDKTAATTTTTTTTSDGATSTTRAGQPAAETITRYASYQTKSYGDPSHWVCRPDAKDLCDGDLDSTTVAADGTLTVEPFTPATDPPIDCFYVYPTISRDKTITSDWNASPDEEGYVTLNQAARLQSQCRLFAPVYRQNTLTSLTANLGGGASDVPASADPPYADVFDAFRTYMAKDNHGRGFVLIGHSQGSAMLSRLIKEEIDPNADVRSHLVAAYLAGWSVAVPEGKAVGGDFQHVPVCTTTGQTGCFVSWASFRATAPPPSDSFFGKPRAGAGTGTQPAGQVAACANPAGLGGGDVDLHSYFPANRTASILSDLGAGTTAGPDDGWLPASAGTITTPYVSLPGLVSASCASKDGTHFLSVTVHPDPAGPRVDDIPGDLTPQWGLHLVDVNLVMGDVVKLVGEQARAYAG